MTKPDSFVTCAFAGRLYQHLMMYRVPSRLFTAIRQLLLLFVVVGFLVPEGAGAMSAKSDTMAMAHVNCAGMADLGHAASDGSTRQNDHADHDVGADCADMACACAMPFTVAQIADDTAVVLISVTPGASTTAPVGICPATFSKPPKDV
jgi:hypothetical protein